MIILQLKGKTYQVEKFKFLGSKKMVNDVGTKHIKNKIAIAKEKTVRRDRILKSVSKARIWSAFLYIQ